MTTTSPRSSRHHVIVCESASQFIEQLTPSHARWDSRRLESEWLFRGQTDATWPLLPSAWRSGGSGLASTAVAYKSRVGQATVVSVLRHSHRDPDKPPFGLDTDRRAEWVRFCEQVKEGRITEFLQQVLFEVQLIKDFHAIADSVGHPVAAPDWVTGRFQSHDIVRCVVDGRREAFFEHPIVAIAQHHGVPTRLLDWTLHPLIAAYFAASAGAAGQGENIAVWALHRDGVKRSRLREFHVSQHLLPFLHAQAGCFLWDPDASADFAVTGRWPSQDEIVLAAEERFEGPTPQKPWIVQVIVRKGEADEILRLLWRERISRAHLMPTFDNVTAAMWRATQWRGDESFIS